MSDAVARMEARIERKVPWFGDRILARHVFTPPTFEAANANLVGGEINGGAAQRRRRSLSR